MVVVVVVSDEVPCCSNTIALEGSGSGSGSSSTGSSSSGAVSWC